MSLSLHAELTHTSQMTTKTHTVLKLLRSSTILRQCTCNNWLRDQLLNVRPATARSSQNMSVLYEGGVDISVALPGNFPLCRASLSNRTKHVGCSLKS